MKRVISNLMVGVVAVITTFGLLYASAASLAVVHTAFPTPDTQTDFGLFSAVENLNTVLNTNMLTKTVVSNNAASSVTLSNGYNIYAGTNVGSQVVNIPAAAVAQDNQTIYYYTQAAIASSVSFASSGATVVGAPATLVANGHVKLIYNAANTTWYTVDQ